jgi:hypothetical protein
MSDDVFVSMSVDLLERGHKVRFRAPGWSMHPSIRDGEAALRFTLRGDALGSPDESVASHQILGKVVAVERGGHSVDPYSWRVKIYQRVRLFASLLKRLAMGLS